MGRQIRKPADLGEKALQFAPKALSLGCSLQYWGSVGSWSRGDALFSLGSRAHFCRTVIMWGSSIRENELLFGMAMIMWGGASVKLIS
jgi:hypothetical protein